MKPRKRDVGERPNTSVAKNRKLQDQQDSIPPGDDTSELERGKRSRPTSKKRPRSKRKPAVQPLEQKIEPEPTVERELLFEPPTDDESSQIEDHIIELLSNAPFPKYKTNGKQFFQREQPERCQAAEHNLKPRDDEGTTSLLEDVFSTNKEEREEENPTQAFLIWLCWQRRGEPQHSGGEGRSTIVNLGSSRMV